MRGQAGAFLGESPFDRGGPQLGFPERGGPGGLRPAPPPDRASFLPPPFAGDTTPTTFNVAGHELPARPEQLSAKPLPLTVPDVSRSNLDNGICIYHYGSTDLPQAYVTLIIRGGERLDPADKVGLARVFGRAIRSGGAGSRGADEFDRALEEIGSDLQVEVERDYILIRLYALSSRLPQAMALLKDMVLDPKLDTTKVEQQRALEIESLRRQNDQPSDIARREFRKLIYGASHPLARSSTMASLKAITRDDLVAFHKAWFTPSSVIAGVSGDVTEAGARKIIADAFGSWQAPPAKLPPPAPLDEAAIATSVPEIAYIKKATQQSQIRLGHLGIPRVSPDRWAVAVLNNVYGTGGFTSRLMNAVRTKQGFVYGVSGQVTSDQPQGLYVAGAASKAQTTVAAINEIMKVTRGLADYTDAVSGDELETAKRDVTFSFFSGLDTPREIVERYMTSDFYGYPADELKNYPERIKAVTADDVRRVAHEYLRPGSVKMLVVGFEKAFDKPLSTLGKVREIKLDDAGAGSPQAASE